MLKAEYKPYPKYKATGVEWIEVIPEGWEQRKIKYIKNKARNSFVDGPFGSDLKSEHFIDNGDVFVIESNFATTGYIDENELKTISRNYFENVKRSQCVQGDLIIAKIGANFGLCNILPELSKPSLVSGNSMKLTLNNKKSYIKYIYYSWLTMKSTGQIDLLSKSTAQPALNLYQLNAMKIFLPTLSEQRAIAAFLDRETTRIDSIIAKQTRMIELLKEKRSAVITQAVTKGLDPNAKMKPSGVEWIGEIPAGWEEKRFCFLFSFGKGLSITKEDLQEDGIPCISYGEIHSKYGFEVDPAKDELKCVDKMFVETSKKALLENGDFMFADTSEDIEGSGNFTYYNGNSNAFAGYHTIITRPVKKNNNSRYIAYLFDSLAYRAQIRSEVTGIKVFSITKVILKDTLVLLPSFPEQQVIVSFLDRETSKIDTMAAKIEKQIELLNEYKQSLITYAVTGKIDVRGEVA